MSICLLEVSLYVPWKCKMRLKVTNDAQICWHTLQFAHTSIDLVAFVIEMNLPWSKKVILCEVKLSLERQMSCKWLNTKGVTKTDTFQDCISLLEIQKIFWFYRPQTRPVSIRRARNPVDVCYGHGNLGDFNLKSSKYNLSYPILPEFKRAGFFRFQLFNLTQLTLLNDPAVPLSFRF